MVDKKRVILFSLFVFLVVLVWLYFVSGSFTAEPASNYTTDKNIRWTRAGDSEIFNMTLAWTVDGAVFTLDDYNITSINLTLPPLFNASTLAINTTFGFIAPNGTTARPIDPYFGNWRYNHTSDIGGGVTLTNKTIIIYELNDTANEADGFGNATVYLWFNFTASSTVANETNATITILFMNNTNKSVAANQMTFQHGIDGLAPRLSYVNVSQPNVIGNDSGANLTTSLLNATVYVSPNATVDINLMVDDANADSAIICYSKNVTTNISELCRGVLGATNATMTRALNSTTGIFAYSLNTANFTQQNNGSFALRFIFFVNDTVGNERWWNNSDTMYRIGVDDKPPVLSNLNITDSVSTNITGWNFTSDTAITWMKLNTSQNISVNLMVDERIGADTAIICYSSNISTNASAACRNALGATNATMTRSLRNATSAVYTYMWNGLNFTNLSQTFTFVIYVNDTNNHWTWFGNNATVYFKLDANTTGYKFKTDGTAPVANITIYDDDKMIPKDNNISIRCNGSDTFSGVLNYSLVITGPTSVTTTYGNGSKNAFNETGLAGVYNVSCTVGDKVGFSNVTTDSFQVLNPAAETPSGGGGGGSSSNVEGELSTTGVTKLLGVDDDTTFVIDKVKHTARVTEISLDYKSVTLVITSTPITVNIKVGEMKKVDLNRDGVNDITITFLGFKFREAELVFKSIAEKEIIEKKVATKDIPTGLEEGTNEPPELPTVATEEPKEEKPVTAESNSGKTIGLILIIIGIIGFVWIYSVKKSKKR